MFFWWLKMLNVITKYWIEFLLTSLTTGFIYVFKQYIGLKTGMIALLRNEIVRMYENYIALGYCPSYMKENVNNMYESYHKLGCNGMITTMVNDLFKLPNERTIIGDTVGE